LNAIVSKKRQLEKAMKKGRATQREKTQRPLAAREMKAGKAARAEPR
jgi:hypothetical protein